MNELEKTIAQLLRPPRRAYRGEAVERLALARDRVNLTDDLTGTTRPPESRVNIARVSYSEVGWLVYVSGTADDTSITADTILVTADVGVGEVVFAGSDLVLAGDETVNAGASA